MQKKIKNKGFTLIELLVVISIIGLISSIITARLTDARDKARIARTIQDLHQIENAFQMIYDKYGCWPLEGTSSTACANTTIQNPYVYSELAPTNIYGIKDYINTKMPFPFDSSKEWAYSNNVIDEVDCSRDNDGILVYIPSAKKTVYEKLEMAIDGTAQANLYSTSTQYCGKIQYEPTTSSTGDIDYIISRNVR